MTHDRRQKRWRPAMSAYDSAYQHFRRVREALDAV
jgi:hypothetical protein